MKKIVLCITLCLLCSINSKAQIEDIYRSDGKLIIDTLFQVSPKAYERLSLNCWLLRSMIYMTKYPEIMRENYIQGPVIVSFVVHPDKTVSDIKIEKSPDREFDYEILRTIAICSKEIGNSLCPKHKEEKYYLPFIFKLNLQQAEDIFKSNNGITIETTVIVKHYN